MCGIVENGSSLNNVAVNKHFVNSRIHTSKTQCGIQEKQMVNFPSSE